MLKTIEIYDPQLWDAIDEEKIRQEEHIELIASENYASERILQLQGSLLTNKYAEGYSHNRYYGGCHYVDKVEDLAVARAKALYGADYANVQPHSGSQANAAVYMALLKPGDLIMGMDPNQGGHFTHGATYNYSGQTYKAISYGLDKNELLDYDEAERLAHKHRPKLIVAGFSSYSRIVDWQRIRDIADSVDAFMLVDMSHISGLVAGGVYPSPLKYADVVTSTTHKTLRGPRGGMILSQGRHDLHQKLQDALFPGIQAGPLMHVIAAKAVAFKEAMSPEFAAYQQQVVKNAATLAEVITSRGYSILSGKTENHLMVIDLLRHGITGMQAVEALGKANITANKNILPIDPQGPDVTCGLRLGSPASTTRGFKEAEMLFIGNWVAEVLADIHNVDTIKAVRRQVLDLCDKFPVYGSYHEIFKQEIA
ncbi:MAG: serine hydroxymethyltransferase [Candidatus Portiera sp.]|nr:serine hydroxymethyltransferase [Portiera sp.]